MASDSKAWLDLVGGLVFSGLGIISFASNIGYPFALPSWLSFLYNTLLIKVSLIIGGIMLFLSSFSMARGGVGGSLKPVLVGLLLAVIGAFPLMMDYKLLGFLPFSLDFTIPTVVLSGLLAAYGIYLLYASYRVHQRDRMDV